VTGASVVWVYSMQAVQVPLRM